MPFSATAGSITLPRQLRTPRRDANKTCEHHAADDGKPMQQHAAE
jgi:hypothetical protein